MTKQDFIDYADSITVINDGQTRYPVETVELKEWIAANGNIYQNYQSFCDEVEHLGAEIGTPGSAAMNDLCDELIAAGADSI